MSAVWTLKNFRSAASGTLASFGFQNPVISQTSQKTGTLSVDLTVSSLDDAQQFEYGDLCVLYRWTSATAAAGTPWFCGKCRPSGSVAAPESESRSLEFTDPWFSFERTVYRKNFKASLAADDGATGGYWTGHIALNISSTGSPQSIATELDEICHYGTTHVEEDGGHIPFTYVAADLPDPPFAIWRDEVRNITMAEAVRRQLRYLPGVSIFFDHSAATAASPKPLLKMVMNEDMASVTLPVVAGTGTGERFNITRVWDQEVPCVLIQYEKTNSLNGKPFTYIVEDKFPLDATGFEMGALIMNVDLAGQQKTTITQRLATRPFTAAAGGSTDASRLAWWQSHAPMYNDSAATGYGITSVDNVTYLMRGASGQWVPATGAFATPYDYEVIDGVWSSWMQYTTDTIHYYDSDCFEVGVSGLVNYKRKSGDLGAVTTHEQAVGLMGSVLVTNINAGPDGQDYTIVNSNTPDEATPSGLAEWMYTQLAGPLFMGSVSFVQDELDNLGGTLAMGTKINIDVRNQDGSANTSSPDYALWRSMNATVQKLDHQLETGKTIVTFGPPKHLGIPDIIELLRAQRIRAKWTNPLTMANGSKSLDATNAGSRVFREVNSSGVPTPSKKTSKGAAGTGGRKPFTHESV